MVWAQMPQRTSVCWLLGGGNGGVGKQRPGRRLSSSPTESALTHVEVSSCQRPTTWKLLKGWNPDPLFLEPKSEVTGITESEECPRATSRAACRPFPGHLSTASGPLPAFTVRTVAMLLLDAEEITEQPQGDTRHSQRGLTFSLVFLLHRLPERGGWTESRWPPAPYLHNPPSPAQATRLLGLLLVLPPQLPAPGSLPVPSSHFRIQL